MFARVRRLINQFFNRSSTINNEPLNKVSLVVIILIDIFILINVFAGLDDISRWYISPLEAYPCYSEWQSYRTDTNQTKDYEIIRRTLAEQRSRQRNFQQIYQDAETGHLGEVSEICLTYGGYKDKIPNAANQTIIKVIEQKQGQISKLQQANRTIRTQYDSTLLEKIAGQESNQSINSVRAEQAKQELDQNNRQISTLSKEISNLKNDLVTKPESVGFIAFLQNGEQFKSVEQGYQQASFWYPSIQLTFQAFFLLPLILLALLVHQFAQRRRYGLVSLISWHLLVIFLIPLVLKIFEFLQVGAIFELLFDIVGALLGGLLFLISYVYILLIPLVGFGIIKFFQKIVFNPKLQAANRVQKSQCLRCARKIQIHDSHCPHCGYYQYLECQNCHNLTYKHLAYCRECGYPQDSPTHS